MARGKEAEKRGKDANKKNQSVIQKIKDLKPSKDPAKPEPKKG